MGRLPGEVMAGGSLGRPGPARPGKGWAVRILIMLALAGAAAALCLVPGGGGMAAAGEAQLTVKYFGLDEALNRAGREVRLVCDLEVRRGEPARRLVAAVELPSGVALTSALAIRRPALERREELAWLVRGLRPGRYTAKLRLTGANFAPLEQEAKLLFTVPVSAAPALVGGRPYVPEPRPARSNYLVGAYYFPGWKQGVHGGWQPIMDYPERKPVLGWYQEGTPEVADWHIKWAVEHGISFFAYDWYWDRGARQLDHALHDGYFGARYRKYLKFCLLWANHNPRGSASEADLLAVTRYWLDHYFKRPEYLRIDNKPVVIIFAVDRITEDMGTPAAQAAFAKMRALCRAEGLGGLYLVGCAYPPRERIAAMQTQGYDAATGYNYAYAGMRPGQGNRAPYDSAIAGYRDIWEEISGYGLLDYIAVTDPGWDSRPWHGESALARTGKSPGKFKRMLELARQFADRHPVGQQRQKLVLVEAWNEVGEGDFIEPHRQAGFGYLDAIREVFTDAPRPHQDLAPGDVGLAAPQWPSLHAWKWLTEWEFDREGEAEGWVPGMGLTDFLVRGGALQAAVKTSDPALWVPVDFDAEDYPRAVLRMRLDRGEMAQLFWTTRTSPESEPNSLRFPTIADNQYHEYTLDLASVPTWQGEVIRLRLDPNSDPESRVAVDYFRLQRRPQ